MRITTLATLLALAPLACSSAPDAASYATQGGASGSATTGSSDGGTPGASSASDSSSADAASSDNSLVLLATAPSGVQCIVASVSGADTETVSASLATGATSVSLAFGSLAPGAITVTANAYSTACPATGTPTWSAEPVSATVVTGVATQIALTFRPTGQTTTGAGTFSLPAIAIAAGPRTSYAVLSDGTVRAWGSNAQGEFGSTTLASSPTPVVVPGITNAVQIAAGNAFACVIRTDSSVMCWGYNAWSFVTSSTTPVNVIAAPTLFPGLTATGVSALGTDVAFIGGAPSQSIGTVSGPPLCFSPPCYPAVVWGGSVGAGPGPSVAAGPPTSAGVSELCWVSEEGAAECSWGSGTVVEASAAGRVFAGLEPSGNTGCAILQSGLAQCWGANTYGELGLGTTAATSPSTVVSNLKQVTAIAMSRGSSALAHTCAVANGGAVLCSGNNSVGQLGNTTSTPSTTFTAVADLSYAVTALAAGQSHTCALDAQGTVHCWGVNDDGELGDGTITTRFAPVTVQPW